MTSSPRLLVVYANEAATRTLSYQHGWPRAFERHPRVRATGLNLAERGAMARLRRLWLLDFRRFDGIVFLHSVFSNMPYLTGDLYARFAAAQTPKALFLGNEYKQLPEKVAFARGLGLSLLVTMLHHPRAVEGYRARVGCAVTAMPSAGVDPDAFAAAPVARDIDIGYRAYEGPLYLGHRERSEAAAAVAAAARPRGLVCDMSLDPADRIDADAWPSFLARCQAQLGTEAGGDWLDFDDRRRLAVNAAQAENPDLGIAEVKARFFADGEGDGAGRALSGRVSEAAMAGCVQILLEGDYSGYYAAGRDYIALRKDYANLEDCLDALNDSALCARLVASAREVTRARLAYPALIDRFLDAWSPVAA